MTADNNKDVVRRFIEVLESGKPDQIDELVAPGYVNRAMGGGVEAIKQMLAAMSAVLPDRRFVIEDLVAEGDAVVARLTGEMRDGSGKTISWRELTFYRLADGKIVENEPMSTPDLSQELGSLLGSPPA